MPAGAPESQPDLHLPSDEPVEVVETHISWVFLAADRAYKVKKPVVFPFLDYGTAERRRKLCEEEVRLNRRLAPELYLGVRGLARDNGGWALVDADDAAAQEWAVEMLRFDEKRTLASLLAADEVADEQVAALGRLIARFHCQAGVVDDGGSRVEAARRATDDNFNELLDYPEAIAKRRVAGARRFVNAFLAARGELLEQRARAGLVRECHGDLRAEHVLLGDRIDVFDCIEFARHLREIDVVADLAFLVMDLVHAGREDLADPLVKAYREDGGDLSDDALLPFFAAYRAWVRTKVACLRAGELPSGDDRRPGELAAAGSYAATARHFEWRARAPFLLVICGGSGTGKTYLAERLAAVSGWRHLNSDPVRKELLGLPPTEHAPADAYTAHVSRRAYAELGRRAATELAAGRGVIVDATFRFRRDREAFRTALGSPPRPLFVECSVPAEVLVERAAQRRSDVDPSSDAGLQQMELQQREFEPMDELEPGEHVAIRTDRDAEAVVDDVEALLDQRLGQAAGS